MRAYFVVAERKQASVRAGLMWRPGAGTAEEFERALEAAKFKENQGDDRVRVSGIKIVSDGGMTLRSAFTRQAYTGEPDNHGTLAVDAAAYKQSVLLVNRHGWRVGTHAAGYAAIDLVLDAYAAAGHRARRSRGAEPVAGRHPGHRRNCSGHGQPGEHPQPVCRPVHHGHAQGSRGQGPWSGSGADARGSAAPVHQCRPLLHVRGAKQGIDRSGQARRHGRPVGRLHDIKDIRPMQTIVDGKVVYAAAE